MKLVIEKPVTVITPTVGSPKLKDAIESISNQTYKCKHLIVCDGIDYFDQAYKLAVGGNIQFCVTPENTGADGFNGQRIYAAYPHLVNSDYIAFLDEDNWFEPNHIETLVNTIESKNLDFAFSLRKIFDPNKKFVCNDECESLGKWPIFMSRGSQYGNQFLVDTSSYLFKRDFIQKTCHLWHSGAWGEDRRYFYAVKDQAKFDTSGQYSLCYRLDGNPKSVSADFFIQGNKTQEAYYGGNYPWRKIV
jgi:glycosyltransferase involved in cell wall biosynthesis